METNVQHRVIRICSGTPPARPPELPEERPPETPPQGPDPDPGSIEHPPVELPPRPPVQNQLYSGSVPGFGG